MFRIAFFSLLVIPFFARSVAVAGDPVEDAKLKLTEFLDYCATLRDAYSFSASLVRVEWEGKTRGQSPDSITESLFRKVSHRVGNRDIIRFERRTGSGPGGYHFQHSLCLAGKTLHAFDVEQGGRLKVFPDPVAARVDVAYQIDPFTICCNVGSVAFFVTGDKADAYHRELHIRDATYLKNGRLKCRAINKAGICVHEFTFEKDSALIVEMRHASNFPGRPINYQEASDEDVSKFKVYGESSTKWKKLQDGKFVPVAWTASQVNSTGKHSVVEEELLLDDWRFQGDVQLELLDEQTFTKDHLVDLIDFDAMAASFSGRKAP